MLARSTLFFALTTSAFLGLGAISAGCSYGVDSYTVVLPTSAGDSEDPCGELLDAGVPLASAIALLAGKDDGGCLADSLDAGTADGSGGASGAGGETSSGGSAGTAGEAGSGGTAVSAGGSGG